MLKNKKTLIAAAVGAGLSAWTVSKYLRNKNEAIQQLRENSLLLHTALGPIEAAIIGEGPAVLVLHGVGGGYDQGLLHTHSLAKQGFKVIAISRPGYLRTPLETGRTHEEQADACAGLLDELGIQSAAVVGISAGGPPSLHFALRYPDRCWGVVLISAVNSSKPYTQLPIQEQVAKVGLSTMDFPVWLLIKVSIAPLVGPKTIEQIKLPPVIKERLQKLMVTAFPMSLRTDGGANDLTQIKNMPDFPLDQINTPTLVIHGDADFPVPFEHGERSAENIPNAEFLSIPGGSHLCYLTHLEQTEPVMLEFLKNHASE